MTSNRLSSLALIHEHKDANIDVDQEINVFASEKCRTPFLDWRWIKFVVQSLLYSYKGKPRVKICIDEQ